jgi:hypothetical protein
VIALTGNGAETGFLLAFTTKHTKERKSFHGTRGDSARRLTLVCLQNENTVAYW